MRTNIIGIVADDHQLFADSFSSFLENIGLFTEINNFTDTKSLFQLLFKQTMKGTYF